MVRTSSLNMKLKSKHFDCIVSCVPVNSYFEMKVFNLEAMCKLENMINLG